MADDWRGSGDGPVYEHPQDYPFDNDGGYENNDGKNYEKSEEPVGGFWGKPSSQSAYSPDQNQNVRKYNNDSGNAPSWKKEGGYRNDSRGSGGGGGSWGRGGRSNQDSYDSAPTRGESGGSDNFGASWGRGGGSSQSTHHEENSNQNSGGGFWGKSEFGSNETGGDDYDSGRDRGGFGKRGGFRSDQESKFGNRRGGGGFSGDDRNGGFSGNDRDDGFSGNDRSGGFSGGFGGDGGRFGGDGGSFGGEDRRGGSGRGRGRGRGGRRFEDRNEDDDGGFGEQKFGGFGNRGGQGGDKGCFKCGGPHMARDCSEPDTRGSSGRGGRSGGDRGCFRCGGDHMARDCSEPDTRGSDRGGFRGGRNNSGDESGMVRKPVATYVPPDPSLNEDELFRSISKGINFDKYEDIPVECTGSDPPKHPVTSFQHCDIHDLLKVNVVKAKYDMPTPIQKWAIPVILAGRDLMGCAQTGSGKTAGFLLPVLTGMLREGLSDQAGGTREPLALVVGPTRELVTQIFHETRKFSAGTPVRPVVLYGGVSVAHQMNSLQCGADIVIATPGRLLDFINRGVLSLARIRYLILDEADRMLDMGFKGDIMKLCYELGMPPKEQRQTLLFSATFPEEIQQIAAELMNDYIFIAVGQIGGANQDIEQRIENVLQSNKKDRLIELLKSQPISTKTMVFVEKKIMADFLALLLCQCELPTTSIHGDREQREREEALGTFKTGSTPIIVATSVASRGLDIPGVDHVVNYDLPQNVDDYVHRIGRTGRCGNVGRATSFFCPDSDAQLARPLVKILADAHQPVPSWLEELAGSSSGFGGFAGDFGESTDVRSYGNNGGSAADEDGWS